MIVSRKNQCRIWKNSEGSYSRLSGPYCWAYLVNACFHRLYAASIWKDWDLNNKPFNKFKEVNYDS